MEFVGILIFYIPLICHGTRLSNMSNMSIIQSSSIICEVYRSIVATEMSMDINYVQMRQVSDSFVI
jgi:hypothetical protein